MVFSTNKWEGVGLLPLILRCDHYIHNLKKESWGTSLMVQQLRLPLPMQGVRVPSLVRKLISQMPHGQKKKKKPIK